MPPDPFLAKARSTPGWRRVARIRRALVQAGAVAAVAGSVALLGYLVHASLAKQGIGFSFAYLGRPAGINISEGVGLHFDGGLPVIETVSASSSNGEVLLAGLLNSLKVAVLAIVASTVIGVAIGVGRLSTNWLVRKLSFGIVEFVRNTPLLIQLVFWYFAVILRFPPVTAASKAYASVLVSQSGIFLPSVAISDGATPLSAALLAACIVFLAVGAFRRRGRGAWIATGALALAGSAALGFPLALEYPVVGRFGATGGMSVTPEMSAILLAITVNSAGYTAEIVRGAIEALSRGQWEASAALGLSRHDTLRDIVLPQVLRVVLPSLGNRYISLTKDTSLGIAIGYPDLFNVYGTVSNQTGRNLEGVLLVMAAYLLVSWTISGAVNLANSRLSGRGARR